MATIKSKKNSNFNFEIKTYLDLAKHVKTKTNIFISQSAIEHFHYDLKYFKQIKDFIDLTKQNIIQIHLFPSPACLWLYLFHGYRQYNLNSILKILKIFRNNNCYFKLFCLGGNGCNMQHFKSITIPFFFQKCFQNKPKKYFKNLKKNVLNDINYYLKIQVFMH